MSITSNPISTFRPDKLFSGKRGLLFATILVVNFVVWFDSVKFGLLNPYWAAELRLGPEEIGLVSSAHLLGYFPVLLIAGFLSDRFGAKKMLIICLTGVTVLSISTGLVQNFEELYWRELIFGVFFGFSWGPAQRLISNWFPGTMGPKATAVWVSSVVLPNVLAPLITYPLADMFGWRVSFLAIAAAGVPALILLIFFVSETPASMRSLDAVERTSIQVGFEATNQAKLSVREVFQALKKPSIITMGIATAFGTSATWLVGTWLPYGLITLENVNTNVVTFAIPLIFLLPVVVGFFHGALVDRFFKSRLKPWLVIGPLCGVLGFGFAALFPGSPWFLWAFMIAGVAYLSDPFFWGTVNSYWAGLARPEVTGTLNGLAAALQVAVGWFVVSQSGGWIDTNATGLAQLSPILWVGAVIFGVTIIPVLVSREVRLRKIGSSGKITTHDTEV